MGVTSRTAPEACAVELVPEAGPCAKPIWVIVPTDATPTVQGAPITVVARVVVGGCTWIVPPAPTSSENGIEMFAVAFEQALNKQTLVTPASGMTPPSVAPEK
jgi:hypothetical protein